MFNPVVLWVSGYQTATMLFEAQTIIGMRLLGLAGMWSLSPGENMRMITEKIEVTTQATTAAGRTALNGGSANEIFAAGLKPVRKKTRSNARRLRKRGWKSR